MHRKSFLVCMPFKKNSEVEFKNIIFYFLRLIKLQQLNLPDDGHVCNEADNSTSSDRMRPPLSKNLFSGMIYLKLSKLDFHKPWKVTKRQVHR
jgi:hypothetical protein